MIDTNKCRSDPRFDNNHLYLAFLYIALKVQDKHYLFLKSIPFILFVILFYIFSESSHQNRLARIVSFVMRWFSFNARISAWGTYSAL